MADSYYWRLTWSESLLLCVPCRTSSEDSADWMYQLEDGWGMGGSNPRCSSPFFTLHVGRLIFRTALKIALRAQSGGPRSIYFHGTTVPDGFIEPIPRSEIEGLYKCPGNRLTDVLITEQPSLSILSTEPDRYSYKVHSASIPRYSAPLK